MTTNTQLRAQERLQELAAAYFFRLARDYPICAASDEFYYFPQATSSARDWSRWDEFSPEAVTDFLHFLSHLETELGELDLKSGDQEEVIDRALLLRSVRTLREQLSEVRFWQTQPTFYLSVASIGLAQALESQDPAALSERAKNLPTFLAQAQQNLGTVPEVFWELGVEMARDLRAWLLSLLPERPVLKTCGESVDRFLAHLSTVKRKGDFRLPEELFGRIVKEHLGAEKELSDLAAELELEVQETQAIMSEEARRLSPGKSWGELMESWPLPSLGAEGLLGHYRQEVEKLGRHCLEVGLVSAEAFSQNPVRVEPVPSYLSAVRSAAAYSMPAGYPPAGGVFYLLDSDLSTAQIRPLLLESHLLSAHETYPGHHLLDLSRWSLPRPLRRPLEFPLFYEGWACWAEELMFQTGLFRSPRDRLLLARRRFWRALRGQVDLGLQTGQLDFAAAAQLLTATGMSESRARQVVPKYALHPGYELCYTIGLRRFRELFSRYGEGKAVEFAKKVLAQGEISFSELTF